MELQENKVIEDVFDIPDWHIELIELELQKMNKGIAGLKSWEEIKKRYTTAKSKP